MPDLFFSNEREGHKHNIIVPNVYVRISPNGSILYSIRWYSNLESAQKTRRIGRNSNFATCAPLPRAAAVIQL